ncbi:MAG: glucokinase [Pyrinomonadaceae bacterium]
MILAGDIGGTNTRLALFRLKAERLEMIVEETFPSRQYSTREEIARMFVGKQVLSGAGSNALRLKYACFGVAGPVKNGDSHLSNLPWEITVDNLRKALAIEAVTLINDLEANAYGIAELDVDDFVVLNPGAEGSSGNAAIISAGTGLGEAGLYWDGSRHHPFACEGGHTDFAPRNKIEFELMQYLLKTLKRAKRVSYERLVSGPGLFSIYKFLRDTGRGEEPEWLALQINRTNGNDPAAVISQVAMENKSNLCVQSLDLFISLYGSEAGNLALKMMATGGVFIGGGIAPKIVEKLKSSSFIDSMTNKGRMKPLLESIPVSVILNDKTALLGAARRAINYQPA